mgnify:CR=1 FL=1
MVGEFLKMLIDAGKLSKDADLLIKICEQDIIDLI